MDRPIVSVLVECNGRTYRVIDNLRELLRGADVRSLSEARIGRKVLDLARRLELDVPTVPEGDNKA